METIIKKAIEGGYINIKGYTEPQQEYLKKVFNEQMYQVVCDPLFWQSLGKACGWELVMDRFYCQDCGDKEMAWVIRGYCRKCGKKQIQFTWTTDRWKKNALHFHEINLTEGWDKAVAYLEDLIK